jgi:hypothetical protein
MHVLDGERGLGDRSGEYNFAALRFRQDCATLFCEWQRTVEWAKDAIARKAVPQQRLGSMYFAFSWKESENTAFRF